MMMKRRIWIPGVVGALVLSGIISGGAVLAKKRLVWWAIPQYTWTVLAKNFEKQNPGVEVTIVNGPLEKFYTMVTAGIMPDVWGPWLTAGITADVNRNWALDLTPYIKRDSQSLNIGDFYPGLMRQFKVKGKQYSLPIFYYMDWFFYNTDRYAQAGLEKPPVNGDKDWTWEKMISNAQKITKTDSQGKITQPGLEFDRSFANWARIWGAKIYPNEAIETSLPDKMTLNTPAMVTALTKAWEIIYKYKLTTPDKKSFANEDKVGSSLDPAWINSFVMQRKNLKWAVGTLPWGTTNDGTSWPDGWRISSRTKDKELAWKFVKYLCSPEAMRIAASDPKSTTRGLGVARKSVFGDTMAQDISRVTGMSQADIMKVFDYGDEHSTVKEQETVCLHEDINNFYVNPVLQEFWKGRTTPQAMAAKLQQAADKAMPILYQRWLRNVKFTGADKKK